MLKSTWVSDSVSAFLTLEVFLDSEAKPERRSLIELYGLFVWLKLDAAVLGRDRKLVCVLVMPFLIIFLSMIWGGSGCLLYILGGSWCWSSGS